MSGLTDEEKMRAERASFERLKAELGVAFAAPDETYGVLTAQDVIARNQADAR
jgi:antitoxin ParD1/3/4